MATEVIMPKVDMDQETGTISEWVKHNGDQVKEGETILVIETAKVAIDVEAPASGILDGIHSQPGDEMPIGTIIAYILQAGEKLPTSGEDKPAKSTPIPQDPTPSTKQVLTTPVARNMANVMGIELNDVKGTGVKGKITKNDVTNALPKTEPDVVAGKVYATPAARRIAEERGIDLNQVTGSGPKQRIQAIDVSSFILPSKQSAASTMESGKQEDEVIPLIGMRNTIAQRLTMSYQTIPHIKFTARIDMTGFNQTRAALNTFAEKSGGEHITATAMFVKITAAALAKHPYLNASLKNESIILHKDINIGVAVALDGGLIVPVVHDAAQKGVAQIASETRALSIKARDGQLQPADVSAGTFTISNLGPFGVEQFDAIINPPQSAILAIGATQNEVVPQGEQITIRPIMRITLSADHRIIDGAVAAKFIAELKDLLENPLLLLYER